MIQESLGSLYLGFSQIDLIRALRVSGQQAAAIERTRSMLEKTPFDAVPESTHLTAELSWLLRERGEPDLALVNSRLYDLAGTVRPACHFLAPERARVLVAMNRPAEAERFLEDFLRLHGNAVSSQHRLRSDIQLMLGFLRLDRGDDAAASAAFQAARYPRELAGLQELGGGIGLIHELIAGSLGGTLDDAQAQAFLDLLTAGAEAKGLISLMRGAILLPPSALRDCWRTPRGRALARRFIFQQMTFTEQHRMPLLLIGLEAARQQQLFGEKMTRDQEEFFWQTFDDALSAAATGKLTQPHLIFLGAAAKGITNAFGWGGVKSSLKELRGPFAYLLGRRYLTRNMPKQAHEMFQDALQHAEPESALLYLAVEELQRFSR